MKLEPGKSYVTRNGIQTPPLQNSKNGTGYAFGASIQEPEYPDKSVRSWDESGRVLCAGQDHRLDLVALA